jgi:hypothetical protein
MSTIAMSRVIARLISMGQWIRWPLMLILVCSFLSGCFLIKLLQGGKSLKDIKIRKLEMRLASGMMALCPGHKDRLVVDAFTKDGQLLSTNPEARSTESVAWNNYALNLYGGNIDDRGNLQITSDVKELWTHPLIVKAVLVHDATKEVRKRWQVTYSCKYLANHSGESGIPGREGQRGQRGQDGISRPSTGSGAGHGGNGSDGRSGGNGEDGRSGQHGHDVFVRISMIQNPKLQTSYIQVLVRNRTRREEQLFVLHPRKGRLNILANGGRGGHGGNGGAGGDGGNGGSGETNGDGGNGGYGGDGGHGGDGGDGGRITILADPAVRPYLQNIQFFNRGGWGGRRGSGGTAGSGGRTFSGGRAGQRGNSGRSGNSGQKGVDGPTLNTRYRPLLPLSMQAPPRPKSFADIVDQIDPPTPPDKNKTDPPTPPNKDQK